MNTPAGGVTLPESRFDTLAASIKGCGDKSCLIERPTGMATNGGCRCYRDPVKMQRVIAAFNEAKNTRAAVAGEWRVPEGFVLVPVEATEAMKQAAYAQQAEFMRQLGEHCDGAPEPEDLFVLMWRAAISAAPLPKEPGR